MNVQLSLLATLVVSVTLVVLIKFRDVEHDKESKRFTFQDIKLRVARDVLREYQNEMSQMHGLLDKTRSESKKLEEEMKPAQEESDKAKTKTDACEGEKKSATDELANVEKQQADLKAKIESDVSKWKTETENLKKQFEEKSPVCNFRKPNSPGANTFCGEEPKNKEPEKPKEGEAKAETPKQEEKSKEEAPKQEEKPKEEAPKQ